MSQTYLCRQNVLVTRPAQLLERITHLDLTLALGVHLSRIEEVDAITPSCLHALLDNVALLCSTVGEPSTQGEDRHLQASGAQVAELHVLGLEFALDGRHDG